MDVTIPPHNLKRFTASLTCLSKIGKDLYVSFDPFDGLTLSSLNEAKSAYAKFHFECGFFQKCAGVTIPYHSSGDDDGESEWRYVCRLPVRSVHSVLRPRKGVLSLRIKSEGIDSTGQHFGVNRKDSDTNNSKEQELCSSRRRKRKSMENQEETADKMMLTFEYCIEPTSNKSQSRSTSITSTFTVLHKIAVTDAHGITLSTSTHSKTRSEVIAPPKLWMRLIDPVKQTQEVALTIDDELKVVTATSFHPSHHGDNVLSRNVVLKTETSIGVGEFDEYDYRNNRKVNNDLDVDENMPEEVNERVHLVFSIKEAKVFVCCLHLFECRYYALLSLKSLCLGHASILFSN